MRRWFLIVRNDHFVGIENLQHKINVIPSVMRHGPARRADITHSLLSNGDDLPVPRFQNMAEVYCQKGTFDRDACVL